MQIGVKSIENWLVTIVLSKKKKALKTHKSRKIAFDSSLIKNGFNNSILEVSKVWLMEPKVINESPSLE
jgi:hypothetical protein